MFKIKKQSINRINKLKGQKLIGFLRYLPCQIFYFGNEYLVGKDGKLIYNYTLHVDSSWRLKTQTNKYIFSGDVYIPADRKNTNFDPGDCESFRDKKLGYIENEYCKKNILTVENTFLNNKSFDLIINFSDGVVLEIFVDDREEPWSIGTSKRVKT